MKMKKVFAKKGWALAALVVVITGYMNVGTAESEAAGKSDVPSDPIDPCVLVTSADVRATLGIAFTLTARDDNVDSHKCEFQDAGQHWLVEVYTDNKERSEFEADGKEASRRNATWGKSPMIHTIAAPAYPFVEEGRLIVWKNKIAVTVGIQEITSTKSDDVLEAAREKLANIALSRIK
jgi:hypothetical protein